MKRAMKRVIPVLAAGLAVGATAVLAPPASADDLYSATIGVTLAKADGWRHVDSVLLLVNGQYTCHPGFAAESPKDISVRVKPGTVIRVISSNGCYNSVQMRDVTITSDGQRADYRL